MVVRFVGVIRVPLCARECLLEITHRYTFTFTQALHTPRRVPHGGGLKGRHAHGEPVCVSRLPHGLFTRSRSFYIFTGTVTVWGAAACAYSPLPSRL